MVEHWKYINSLVYFMACQPLLGYLMPKLAFLEEAGRQLHKNVTSNIE